MPVVCFDFLISLINDCSIITGGNTTDNISKHFGLRSGPKFYEEILS